jgi:hypothetical protein
MKIRLTTHAKERQADSNLLLAWIEAAVLQPDWTVPDPRRPGVTRSFKRIIGRDGRVLRVAHRPDGADVLVLTAFFDRGAKP